MSWDLSGQVFAEGVPGSGASVIAAQFLPGIPVEGVPGARKPDYRLSTTCDPEGSFRVEGLRPGPASVSVRLRGFLGGHARVEGPVSPPLVIHLERGASVRLRHAGATLSRRIPLLLESDRGMWESEIGGPEDVVFDGLPPGLWRIRIEAEDVELVEPLEIRIEAKRGHELVLKLRVR